MIAEQQQLKANYENETKIAKAKADAEAKVVQAEAEAKANDLLEKSLNEKILRQMYIEKWDGKLPSTVAGDSTTMLIPAGEVEESSKTAGSSKTE
jgi:regulator of protease activity HflC (stomatin/prohibitin superfamily)